MEDDAEQNRQDGAGHPLLPHVERHLAGNASGEPHAPPVPHEVMAISAPEFPAPTTITSPPGSCDGRR